MNSDSSKSKTHIEEEMRRVNKLQKVKGQFILSEWKCVNWANYSKKYTLFYKKKKQVLKLNLQLHILWMLSIPQPNCILKGTICEFFF